ncbi:hypothetical protein HK100_010346 [Physocladia obscura]|uniref:Uncharacterized protein n=1 Tax=Physocladia obscura TaxID=109957 RepID=A0AAD5T3Q2_9FUNG|nr:hypothetical protein HK100_010346 [Physocladia obscura]
MKRKIATLLDDALNEGSDAETMGMAAVRISDDALARRAAECARFGWINTGPEKLLCTACGAEFAYTTEAAKINANTTDTAKSEANTLRSAHNLNCAFRTGRHDPLTFPVSTPRECLYAAIARFNALSSLSTALPAVFSNLVADPARVATMLTVNAPPPPLEKSLVNSAALLALFGWEPDVALDLSLSSSSSSFVSLGSKLLKCNLCFRQVTLSKFTPAIQSEYPAVTAATAATTAEKHLFDPHFEHRWYCPWIYSRKIIDSTDDGIVGWKYSLNAIERLQESNTDSNEVFTATNKTVPSSISNTPVVEKIGERDFSDVRMLLIIFFPFWCLLFGLQ